MKYKKIFILLILCMGIGFAYLTSNLDVNNILSGGYNGGGNGGAGGGYYGGSTSQTSGSYTNSAGSGGSGYIGNTNLSNKVMYCYNCTTSDDESTKTISTTNVSETSVCKDW